MAILTHDFLYFVPNLIMDLLDGLRAFVATAESGSFTKAADRLGLSNRLTSKYVAELETRLGTRLLQRTTRRVGLTPAGEDLLARAPALLDDMDDMLADVTEGTRGLSGVLRLSAPVTFGETTLTEMLRRFAAPHPDLTIDLRLDDAHVDLASEGIDLAFRIGEPVVSSLKVQRLGRIAAHLVAAPAYLDRHGRPEHPVDLRDHVCITDTNRRTPRLWRFSRDGRQEDITVPTRFMVNSARAVRDLALAGHGIALCPAFIFESEIETGRLVKLLPDYQLDGSPLSVVYLEGRALPRKVRALIDFAKAEFRGRT